MLTIFNEGRYDHAKHGKFPNSIVLRIDQRSADKLQWAPDVVQVVCLIFRRTMNNTFLKVFYSDTVSHFNPTRCL